MLLPKTHLLHVSSFCRGRLQAIDEGEKQETGEGKFEQGQGAVFGWFNALLGSWWFLPWLYHGWADFQWKLKEWIRQVGVPSISYWSVPDNVLEKQVPQWNWPMLAEITPLNFRFISMGLVVHGLSCFSVPTQKSFWHPASFPFILTLLYTLQLFFFSLYLYSFSRTQVLLPSPSQTAECLPEPSLPPLSPCAPFPSPLDGAFCCHWVRDTALSASC